MIYPVFRTVFKLIKRNCYAMNGNELDYKLLIIKYLYF